jgi:hypothetical protein
VQLLVYCAYIEKIILVKSKRLDRDYNYFIQQKFIIEAKVAALGVKKRRLPIRLSLHESLEE